MSDGQPNQMVKLKGLRQLTTIARSSHILGITGRQDFEILGFSSIVAVKKLEMQKSH